MTDFLLIVRRRLCDCIVASAAPGSAPARELARVFGPSNDYRVVPLIGHRPVVRCPHEGSPYFVPRPRGIPMTSTTRTAL